MYQPDLRTTLFSSPAFLLSPFSYLFSAFLLSSLISSLYRSLSLSLYKKNIKKKTLLTRGDSAEHTLSFAVRSLPLPLPSLSPSLLLFQAAFCGGMVSELRALQQPGLEY